MSTVERRTHSKRGGKAGNNNGAGTCFPGATSHQCAAIGLGEFSLTGWAAAQQEGESAEA